MDLTNFTNKFHGAHPVLCHLQADITHSLGTPGHSQPKLQSRSDYFLLPSQGLEAEISSYFYCGLHRILQKC